MSRRGRPASEIRDEIVAAFRACDYDAVRAAASLGLKLSTFQQRATRAGVSLLAVRYQSGPVPVDGDAVLTGAGVTLTLADYATLQTEAAMGREAARLEAALTVAERVIATLTRELETRAA